MMQSIQGHSSTSHRLWMACVVYAMAVVFEFTLLARRLAGRLQAAEFTGFISSILFLILFVGIGCYFLLPPVFRHRNNRLQISLAIGSILPAVVLTFSFVESMNALTLGGILFLGVAIPVFLFFVDRSQSVFDTSHPELSPIESSLDTTASEETEQSLKRWFGDDRTDCMEGFVTARFLPEQKHANVHVPFQPPFETVPEVECYETTDTSSHVKVALVRSYGMRIELLRSEQLDSSVVVKLHFEAVARAKTDSVSV